MGVTKPRFEASGYVSFTGRVTVRLTLPNGKGDIFLDAAEARALKDQLRAALCEAWAQLPVAPATVG